MWDDIAILLRYLLMLSFNNSLDGTGTAPALGLTLGPKIRKRDKKRRLADPDLTNQRTAQLRSISVPYIWAFWRENNNVKIM